jgi:serine/threonine-protein kinase
MEKELKAGALIATQYVLDRELGSGGMGVVWSAERVSDREKVALKFLRGDRPPSERVCQRFLQEARATRRIGHPGVVQIHDVVEDEGGLPVLVMDLLVGETLASRLEREGPMKAHDAIALLLPAAEALAAAHDHRVVHRDLKPENLFLCAREGEAPEVRVLDFGIAKVMRDDADGLRSGVMTSTGVVLGTPFYMAPEQLFSEGQIDERSDVWAFGVILYECIAGRRPFAGPSVGQVLRLIALDEYTPLEQAAANGPPAPVCHLVERLLARDRALRPRTMRDVEGLLREVLDGTYACGPRPASSMRSPAAQTLEARVDPARPSSSGGDVPVSTSNDSAGLRPDAFLPARRSLAVPLGIGALAVGAALAAAAWLRPAPPAATAAATRAEAVPEERPSAGRVVAPPETAAQTTTASAGDPRTTAGPPAVTAGAAPPSEASQAKPLAARGGTHPATHVDASSPAPAAGPSGEPARRPGSVVDVPPF